MTHNPETRVTEYWVQLNAADFSNAGVIELRATAYPTVGIPRLLDSLMLYVEPPGTPARPVRYIDPAGDDSEGDGSEARPFKTMWKAGKDIEQTHGKADRGIVYMQAGEYVHSGPSRINVEKTWLRFEPAPGVAKSEVHIVDNVHPGLRSDLIHYRNLTVHSEIGTEEGLHTRGWIDGCVLIGPGQHVPAFGAGWLAHYDEIHVTDCLFTDAQNCIDDGAILQRNVHCQRIGEDVFGLTKLLVNASVDDVNRGTNTRWHPDVYHIGKEGGHVENQIVYGLRATRADVQGIFLKLASIKDVALVNVLLDTYGGAVSQFEEISSAEHVLLINTTISGQNLRFKGITAWKYPFFQGCSLQKVDGDSLPFVDQASIMHNHFEQVTPGLSFGSDASVGDPLYVDRANADFRPKSDSPLKSRMPRLTNIDLGGEIRSNPTSVGAYE